MKSKGMQAEYLAWAWLKRNNLIILAKNYHCRWGEIDIIAMDHNTLCFIEVRYRKSVSYGLPAETVSHAKQQRLVRSAQSYLQQHRQYAAHDARFDISSLTGDIDNPEIDWLKNAFMMSA